MWPFNNTRIVSEREQYNLRRELEELRQWKRMQEQQKFHSHNQSALLGAIGGVVPARPKLATDLPVTRVADLAGYLGRVHEQLSFAAIAVAPYDSDPEKTKKTELTLRLRDAADKAAKVQLDLLEIIQQEREEEAARAIEAQERVSSQWTTDELDRMMREGAPPIVPNRIRPMPEPDAHDRGGFEGS